MDVPKSQEKVKVYEVYVRLKTSDEGGTEVHHMVLGESSQAGASAPTGSYTVLYREQVNEVPYAAVRAERIAHTFEGHSLAEELMEIQRIQTVLTRDAVNNVQGREQSAGLHP